jgi:hypothetical protein
MPRLSVWFVRCSLLYLLLGLTLGSLLLVNKGASLTPWIWTLLPAHMEFLLLGWMAQLAMGVAFWILPRFGSGQPRGRVPVIYSAFVLLNSGIWMVALQPYSGSDLLTFGGRALEALSGVLFLFGSWHRIKPLEV